MTTKKVKKTKAGKLDLRTKAGRAWKARRQAQEDRAKARAAQKASPSYQRALKEAVTGSWVDLKDPNHLTTEQKARLQAEYPPVSTHYEGDRCPGGHLHDGEVNGLTASETEKLKATGMYWELFPGGTPLKPSLLTDAVGTTGGKATVAYWRVGV